MAIFAIHLSGETSPVVTRIKEHYPKNHHRMLSDRVYLVRGDTLAETVAANIGIKGDSRVDAATGVVFKLNTAYAGFDNRAIWEWLREAEQST